MERSKSIDVLRAVALMLVCFGRHMIACPLGEGAPLQAALYHVTEALLRGGWVGVDLFFVLSGFLVSGLLFREQLEHGTVSAKTFLIRRGLKIYPAFWLMILISATVTAVQKEYPSTLETLSELAFVQNYGPSLWPHTWSLAVEEHFYLVLVLVLLWLSRRSDSDPFRNIPTLFAVVAGAMLAGRFFVANSQPYSPPANLTPSHLRMDSLFFGVFLAYFYHYRSEQFLSLARRFRAGLGIAGVLLLLPAFCFQLETTPLLYTLGFTLFYLGSGALLMASLAVTVPNRGLVRLLAYIGSHSYSIYLWHIPVAMWLVLPLARSGRWEWPRYAGTTVVAELGIGIAMALLVELPTLRLRDARFPRRALAVKDSAPIEAVRVPQ